MRAFINTIMPPAVDHSGVHYHQTGMLVFGLFIGIIALSGVCTLFNRVTAARMAPCPDGQRRGALTRGLGVLKLANLGRIIRKMVGVMTPAEWLRFARNLVALYVFEALVTGFVYWRFPAFREFYVENWHWVWGMCGSFSPVALIFRDENSKTEALIHYEKAKQAAAMVASTAAHAANTAAETVAEVLLPSGENKLAS